MDNKFIPLFLLCFFIGSAPANEDPIPEFRETDEYRKEFSSSVFLNKLFKTQTISEKQLSDFGKDYVLDGVVEDSEKGLIAFIRNEKEKTFIIASSQGDGEIQIVRAKLSELPQDTSVTVSNGKDEVTLKYGNERFLKRVRFSANARNGAKKPSTGRAAPVPGRPSPLPQSKPAVQPSTLPKPTNIPTLDQRSSRKRVVLPKAN